MGIGFCYVVDPAAAERTLANFQERMRTGRVSEYNLNALF
jgi:hypothetical protein